jgi:polysaccharide deacetylase 2 family uncharacterized protein YibQ
VAKQKKHLKSSGQSGGKRRTLILISIIVIIAAVFSGLELMKKRFEHPQPEKPAPPERLKIPQRETTHSYEQRAYTSSRDISPPKKKARLKPVGPGTLAIIVDDMGSSSQEAKELLSIDLPITFSIIPGLSKVKAVAEAAHAKGRQVMIHMPMEPQGYPRQPLEKNGLLLAQTNDQITQQVANYVRMIPYAVGANNHMGSSFTENEEKMVVVLSVLKEKGLFFIDSRTTPNSVGYSLAEKIGLEAGARNVFLDNVQDVAAIKAQLAEAAKLARRQGRAIAICHPHPTTIQALQEAMPELAKSGITFALASELVK